MKRQYRITNSQKQVELHPVNDGKKVCSKCLQEKLVSEFPKINGIKSGYSPICRKSKNDYQQKKKEENKSFI